MQRRQSFLVLVGCAVAAAVSARALNAYVERRLVASTVGRLIQLGDFLPGESGAPSPPAPPSPSAENALAPEDISSERGTEEEPNETHPHRHRDKRRARPQRNAHGIFVSRATVERLIRAGAGPSGYPVEGSGPRPPGVIVREPAQLRGLLFPGDVITEVQGRTIRTVEDLVLAVGDAQKAGAKFVTGSFWRHGDLWSVSVAAPW